MNRTLVSALALLATCFHASAQTAPWHANLYVGNGAVWSKRIPLTIRNPGSTALAGQPAAVAIGSAAGQADLAEVSVANLRICDASGAELLFAVRTVDGKSLQSGPIPAGATLIIPAECPAQSTATCYVYFDNPSAWTVPDFLTVTGKPTLTATAGKVEVFSAVRSGDPDAWPPGPAGHRLAIRALNSTDAPLTGLIAADVRSMEGYLRARHLPAGFTINSGRSSIPTTKVGDAIFFPATIAPHTLHTWHLYPSQTTTAASSYQDLLNSSANLAKNASFEQSTGRLPAAWSGFESNRPGVEMGFANASRFGQRCARIHVAPDATPTWVGWKQDIPVTPGATYLYAAWVKCQDIAGGSVQLHAHLRTADGQLSKSQGMTGAGPALTGTADWTLLGGVIHVPSDATVFQVHLTMNTTGTIWHDGVVLARVTPALVSPIESRMAQDGPALEAWPVNAIVRVFKHDLPPSQAAEARITAARNEKEPLQIAVRSRKPLSGIRINIDPPRNATGAQLNDVQIALAGYVPIDYPTNYYQSAVSAWHRRIPTQAPGSDGWADWWPDPLLPRNTLDLPPEETHALWLTVSVPKDAAPGDYRGTITLEQNGQSLSRIPFTVHVWDFTLDDSSHVKAVYDVRLGNRWRSPGQNDRDAWRQIVEFMADHRVCPDMVTPSPQIRYENGKVIADFNEFDAAASWYFDTLKLPHSYTPHSFYAFGWGMPPSKAFGQEPYPGQRPFVGADRSQLRPEYKQAYQACLRAFWDHVKQKGWDRKILLYICDEPFDAEPAIRQQMKALCAMIHEVDPAIPIYCSTWHHVPDWDGSITAWGIGHYGVVPPAKIAQIRASRTKVLYTTDGHMCTDTPYCAVERLLPHYCFKYNVEGYEFWGSTWLTYDPYQFGWHSFIHQTDAPGKSYYIRYPNGDGYLIYPGSPIDHAGPVSTIRLEQAREGVEDYEYLWLLRQRVQQAKSAGRDVAAAQGALDLAQDLVTMPNAGGRYSTKVLSDPDKVLQVKQAVAQAIESLK